jgi:hypothetical protein
MTRPCITSFTKIAARQWWKKSMEVMAACNYYPSKSDPCLFIKKAENDDPLSFVIIYVNDGGFNS